MSRARSMYFTPVKAKTRTLLVLFVVLFVCNFRAAAMIESNDKYLNVASVVCLCFLFHANVI